MPSRADDPAGAGGATLPEVIVCGLGPGGADHLTTATLHLLGGSQPTFVRTRRHPTADLVADAHSFDDVYDREDSLADVYRSIADTLVAAAVDNGSVVYAVPGSPLVLERSVAHLRTDHRVDVRLTPSMSFLDVAWARLGVDPVEAGVRLVDGHTFADGAAGERGPLLVAHTHARWVLSDIKLAVDAGPEMRAVVLQGLGTADEQIFEVAWPELDRSFEPDHLTSLYLPEVTAPVAAELQRSVALMHRLRQDCPWDQQQTHQSLRRYLLEETYEVLEAIDGLDAAGSDTAGSSTDADDDGYADLEEELGDLWFQILFHAELATEAGAFGIADVARNVHDKLVGRHPHVFGASEAATSDEVVSDWEAIKQEEKQRASVMDGVPPTLPALALAEKFLKRGARQGFAPDEAEIAAVVEATSEAQFVDDAELGRFLLALVEQARRRDLDPEQSLRLAARAAEQRFRSAEAAGREPSQWVFG